MRRRVFVIGGVVILMLAAAAIYYLQENRSVTLEIGNDSKLSITLPFFQQISSSSSVTYSIEETSEIVTTLKINQLTKVKGYLSITERSLPSGEKMVFERLRMLDGEEGKVKVTFTPPTHTGVETVNWNPYEVEHEHHQTFGIDPTVNPFGRITYTAGNDHQLSVVQGNIMNYSELTKSYENGDKSTLKKLITEYRDFNIDDSGVIEYKMTSNGAQLSESWFLISEKQLFAKKENEQSWIKLGLDEPSKRQNWYTEKGPYTKLPFSIEPGTQMGYGRSPGRMEDDVALQLYKETNEYFYLLLLENSRTDLMKLQQEFGENRWMTEYTSTWLKNAYGTTAPYVDTRYNEYIATFLDETSILLNLPSYYAVVGYADYLLSQVKMGNVIEAGDGYFIIDYFKDHAELLTHASVNHELGGLHILLKAYEQTGEERFLEGANKILTAFEVMETKLIRDNGDLWYQVNPDLSVTGNDYEQLTLVDLLIVQNQLQNMGLQINETLETFIQSKMAYLKKEDIKLIPKVTDQLANREEYAN